MKIKLRFLPLFLLMAAICLPGPCQEVKDFNVFSVDYENYLDKHDIVYQSPAYEGWEGFPLGNGDLGGMVWCTDRGLEIQINKSDLFDQPNEETRMTLRAAGRLSIDFGAPCFDYLYLSDFEARLSLKDATANFSSSTPFSEIKVRSWLDSHSNVWVFECEADYSEMLPGGAKPGVSLSRWGSRAFQGWYHGFNKDASLGIGKARASIKDGDILIRESFEGLDFAVACRITGSKSYPETISARKVMLQLESRETQKFRILVSVVSSNESDDPAQQAVLMLDRAEEKTIPVLMQEHAAWWNDFWKKSFVNLGDDYMENIYYLRRYLMGSSSQGKYPVVFNGSLWVWNHDVRQWVTPHHWNTQQSYWGLAAQNDCNLMRPYLDTYFRLMPEAEEYARSRGAENAILWTEPHDFAGRMVGAEWENMTNNFTPASQIAGFFWEYYQFTLDKEFLEERAYPFMKKSAEFYLQYLQWDEEKGEYYIFPSQPYEHAENNQLKNCITDRYMIESLFTSCMEASRILDIDREKREQWQQVMDHLWEPPVLDMPDRGPVYGYAFYPNGDVYPKMEDYKIGGYHFDAHTVHVFPANLLGLDQKNSESFAIARNVALHHPPFRNAITPGAIVSARLGLADQALKNLSNSIRRIQHFPQGLFYNIDHWHRLSLYADSVKNPSLTTQRDYIYDSRTKYSSPYAGSSGLPTKPFIQCGMEPLSIFSTTINEMLLQSHEGKIRVFPAAPGDWPAAFNLRARGAFMVAAVRDIEGEVPGIRIESLQGGECRVQNPWPGQKVKIWEISRGNRKTAHRIDAEDVLVFGTSKGSTYLLTSAGSRGKLPLQKTVYSGSPNAGPKQFREAMLGKERDF